MVALTSHANNLALNDGVGLRLVHNQYFGSQPFGRPFQLPQPPVGEALAADSFAKILARPILVGLLWAASKQPLRCRSMIMASRASQAAPQHSLLPCTTSPSSYRPPWL